MSKLWRPGNCGRPIKVGNKAEYADITPKEQNTLDEQELYSEFNQNLGVKFNVYVVYLHESYISAISDSTSSNYHKNYWLG